MRPYHEPEDTAKVAAIAASLARDGWVGAPLVTWGDEHLLTGAHRYAAARLADWQDTEIPTIDIADVCAEAGLDWDAIVAEELLAGLDDPILGRVLDARLPAATRERYGIDIG